MTYFVTSATGFIGRHLVEELLERTSDIHVLVREGSRARLDDLVADWELSHPGATERVKPVVGDLQHERLVDPDWLHAHTGSCNLSSTDAIGELCAKLLDEHSAIDMLVNNAERSIRRSMTLSHDRFHDYERTMQLNYLGAIKLVMGLIEHMKERGRGHIVNIFSIGAQTSPPRFNAYVASKPRSTRGRAASPRRSSAAA